MTPLMLFMIKKCVILQRSLTKGRRDEAASNFRPLEYDHVMGSSSMFPEKQQKFVISFSFS